MFYGILVVLYCALHLVRIQYTEDLLTVQYTSQRAPPKMSGGSPLCEGKGGFPMEPTGWG